MSDTVTKGAAPLLSGYDAALLAHFSDRITRVESMRTDGKVEIRLALDLAPVPGRSAPKDA